MDGTDGEPSAQNSAQPTHVSVCNRSFMVVTRRTFTQTNSGTLRQKTERWNKSQDCKYRPLQAKHEPSVPWQL
jgi:hypothetical protein